MFYSGLPLPRTAAALGLLLPVTSLPVAAHDAKSGWTYPLSCCSNYDCREVADAEVLERPEGYVIKVTGEVIPMTSRRVKPSPDGVFHWCSVAGRDDGATICLFVPPRGF